MSTWIFAFIALVVAIVVGPVVVVSRMLHVPDDKKVKMEDVDPDEWLNVRSGATVVNPQREKMAESIRSIDLDNLDDFYFKKDYPNDDLKLKEIWRRLHQNKVYLFRRVDRSEGESVPKGHRKDAIQAIRTKLYEIQDRLHGEEDLQSFYDRIDEM